MGGDDGQPREIAVSPGKGAPATSGDQRKGVNPAPGVIRALRPLQPGPGTLKTRHFHAKMT